jgi:prolyl-tRNA synthetase
LAANETRAVRRDDGSKQQLALATVTTTVPALLETIQSDMLKRATQVRDSRLKHVTEWKDFCPALDSKSLVMIPWCEAVKCEEQIKENSAR